MFHTNRKIIAKIKKELGIKKYDNTHKNHKEIENYLINNPAIPNARIATLFGATPHVVLRLRRKNNIAHADPSTTRRIRHPNYELIKIFLIENPMIPNRVIAKRFSADDHTVSKIRKKFGIARLKGGRKME